MQKKVLLIAGGGTLGTYVALTTFIIEIREQAAALRAYDNFFQTKSCNHIFLQRAYDSIFRELLSEIARIFDKANTGSNENCTLVKLKELCYEEYIFLFLDITNNNLLQSLEDVFDFYNQLPIKYSRNKQLSHHDLKQVTDGNCIEISLGQIELLIEKLTDVFAKLRTQFYCGVFEITFKNYDILVKQFEEDIKNLIEQSTRRKYYARNSNNRNNNRLLILNISSIQV